MFNELSIPETERFLTLEIIIQEGFETFVKVGNALLEIRDSRLYRAHYGTFEEYCRGRWGIERAHAYRLIDAAEVVNNLSPIGDILPANESQARPLSKLTTQYQREVWPTIVDTAPNGHITTAHIEHTIEANGYNYKRDNRRSTPSDIYTPQGMDACQTPGYALDPLLPYLCRDWTIWEPAAGEGLLVEALYDSGFNEAQVVFGDILTGQNFFDYEPGEWDCLITNPPYSIQAQWLERCYQLNKPFALLLKVEALGNKGTQELLAQYGIEIIFVSPRINFKMPRKGWNGGGAQFPTAWYTWGLNIGRQITFAKVTPDVD